MADSGQVLASIKSLLSLKDNSQDDVLNTIIDLISARLKSKIGKDVSDDVPDELKYIVVEASISRFNRINDEGKKSASESEVSATYETDDLAPFANDIADWIANKNDGNATGKFVMY